MSTATPINVSRPDEAALEAGSKPPSPGVPCARRPAVVFCNPALVAQSWYVAVRSSEIGRGKARTFDLLNRRIVIYRDSSGTARSMDSACPHLGADLGQGAVEGDSLRCPFHGWRFGPDGSCGDAPGHQRPPQRSVRVYPTEERWGFIWIFNGPQPLFELPEPSLGGQYRCVRLPSQRIHCHPHIVIANGLDTGHYESLHRMVLSTAPRLVVESPNRIRLYLSGRPASRLQRLLTGTRRRDIQASFTTMGSSLAWATVREPVRFEVLFTGRPHRGGGCETQTLVFLPAGTGARLVRAAALMYTLLQDDRRILDHIQFAPRFTERDAPLRAFAEAVNAAGSW